MIFVSGILTAISVYLVLSKSLIRIIMGTTLLTHAANLFLITMGGLKHGTVPIYEKGTASYVDPIPQALILTAIVIAFATTAFFLVLAFRTYKKLGTDNVERMKGAPDDDREFLARFNSCNTYFDCDLTYLYRKASYNQTLRGTCWINTDIDCSIH